MTGVGRAFRLVYGILSLITVESIVFGTAVLPGLLFWQFLLELPVPIPSADAVRYAFIAMTFVPAYIVFCIALMFLTAWTNRLLRWHTPPGEYRIGDIGWNVVRWGRYNATIHVVRLFAGELMRASPLWTMFIRANGAKVGRGVFINTTKLYDHNLLVFEDGAVVGGDAKLIGHLAEGGRIKARGVTLRRGATVGVQAIVGPGVEIGENASVGAMSFVPKGTRIPANCAYGGVPARLIKRYDGDGDGGDAAGDGELAGEAAAAPNAPF